MPTSIDIYKRIFLHVIPVRITFTKGFFAESLKIILKNLRITRLELRLDLKNLCINRLELIKVERN